MSLSQRKPIAAIATAPGEAGISVIRVSGKDCFNLVNPLFKAKDLTSVPGHTIHFGKLRNLRGEVVDELLISVFKSPHSYTGEDTLEISCHGGVLITREVLSTILSTGIEPAQPGEFTHRAFLNGKMELSQAEAVADLIHAKSKKALASAHQQLEGKLGEYVKAFRQSIIDATAMIELELDFVEEDVEFANMDELMKLLNNLEEDIEHLMETYEAGRLVKHGVRTVFIGAPNAGKSTLLNTLVGKDRAIVTEIAGTTRDVIDADWTYDGIYFKLTDTAGIRETTDRIEVEGVKRSQKAITQADLIVYLHDLSRSDEEQITNINALRNLAPETPFMAVGTKKDLAGEETQTRLDLDLTISAVKMENIDQLKKMMKERALENQHLDTSGLLVTSARHRDALEKTKEHVASAKRAINLGMSGDLLAIDLRSALQSLGTITGEITNEDVLDSIFSRFCIGK
jgi:tRNA modification GTPase